MRRAVLTASILLAASCATRQPMTGQPAPDVDRKLSTFAFIEEGKLATFVVGTRPTRYRDNAGYVPVEIAIANRGVKTLSLTRESFTLADENGNRYPCASPKELLANYDFLELDRNLAELSGTVFSRFGAMTGYPTMLSPTRAPEARVVTDSVELPKFGYMLDMLYFPMPATGLIGHKFELSMTAPELTDPIFVKFEVK
jgi:hypothetical protein